MTKLKNTKKGMAKKALSVSLVAAMLATSNVPVWAAEDLFTDGSSAAVEAPVVEEPAAEVEAFSAEPAEEVANSSSLAANDVITESDIDVSGVTFTVNNENVEGKTVKFGDTITIGGSIAKKAGGNLKEFNYGWRVKGDSIAFVDGEITNGDTANALSQMSLDTSEFSAQAGKTIELYIFRQSNTAVINPTVVGEVTIEKDNIDGARLLLDINGDLTYNGKDYVYGERTTGNTVAIKGIEFGTNGQIDGEDWGKDTVLKYYNISTTQSARNAGEKLIITATPKADSPYQNSISAEATIKAKEYAAGDLVTELNEGLTYQYTGERIDIPAEKIKVKEKPEAFADAVLSSDVIKEAYVAGNTISESSVKVVVSKDDVKNFDLGADRTFDTVGVNKVEIKARDLSATSTSITVLNGKIPVGLWAGSVAGRLIFKGTEAGNPDISLANKTDYTVVVRDSDGNIKDDNTPLDSGTYTATITAIAGNNAKATGGQTIEFVVGNNVVSDVTYAKTYTPAYTGAEIRPTESDFGNLVITESLPNGKENKITIDQKFYDVVSYKENINASTYDENGKILTKAYATVKILDNAGSYEGEEFDVAFEILPLTVSNETVTVPETISYDESISNTDANGYKVPLIVTAKDSIGKVVKGLAESDYTVEYSYSDDTPDADGKTGNTIGNEIKSVITITNPNFMGAQGKTKTIALNETTEIVAKALTNDMIKINPSSYTYTGGNITPEFVVMDGVIVLYDQAEFGTKGEYKVYGITANKNVGTATLTVEGVNNFYSGKASATFEITPADTQSVKVEVENQDYTGRQVRPRMDDIKVTLNGNDVSSQFEIASYGENINAGTGTVVLKTKDGNKNFTGANVTAEFNIVKEEVSGTLAVYDSNGANVTEDYSLSSVIGVDPTREEENQTLPNDIKAFDFDGSEKTFSTERLTLEDGTKAQVSDFEIKYAGNVAGKNNGLKDTTGNDYNIAYVYAVAKEGTGYAGTKTLTLSDGSQIKNVVAYMPFAIKNVYFDDQNVTVKNGTYAGGLPVKPEVLVQIKGNTLVEGRDYELELSGYTSTNHYINPTSANIFKVKVIGKGGYVGSASNELSWGIDKKDIADCDVAVTNGVVTVMNGYIPVPVTEYTSKNNGDGTYTITANTDSKNYTGSKTVTAEGQAEDEKPDAPMIQEVRVSGNNATVVLSGETEGATGYDYVISADRDCINNKDYDKVNKNILGTETTFTYTQQGVYYAYCHAWKRVDGVKVFSDWSEAYPFVVSAITPEQPVITSVKKSGRNLTVTWTQSENATTGYDVVMGTAMRKVNGEMRPVEYGKAVKKVGPNTFSVTFKSIPKGTYYVGLHAHNRTSESGVKVFSPWSNAKKVTF